MQKQKTPPKGNEGEVFRGIGSRRVNGIPAAQVSSARRHLKTKFASNADMDLTETPDRGMKVPFVRVSARKTRPVDGRQNAIETPRLDRLHDGHPRKPTARRSPLETGPKARAPHQSFATGRARPGAGGALVPRGRAATPAIDDARALRCLMTAGAASVGGTRRLETRNPQRKQNRQNSLHRAPSGIFGRTEF